MTEPKRAAEALMDADAKAAETTAKWEDSLAVRLLDPIATLGDQPQLRVLCGATIAVGLFAGDRKLAATGLRMLAAHTIATWAKDFVKHRVDRVRPRALAEKDEDHRPEPGRSQAKDETSFPSGHSAGAAAVAAAFARGYPEHAGKAAVGAAILAGAQIPRCAHYPTDVGAGLAIGVAAEVLTTGAERLARRLPLG